MEGAAEREGAEESANARSARLWVDVTADRKEQQQAG